MTYEQFRQEALDNYGTWGQWFIECYDNADAIAMFERDGADEIRRTCQAIEEQHQEIRSTGEW